MTRFDGLIYFLFGKKRNAKLYSPDFVIKDEIVKDFNISQAIPRFGRNYFKISSTAGIYEMYVRAIKENRDDKIHLRSTLLKKYNLFGKIENRFILNIESLLPYVDSVVVDKSTHDKSVRYIFRFIREDEQLDIDGYLVVAGEPGLHIMEKIKELG